MNNEQISFEIISKAGDAFSKLMEALKLQRLGKSEEVEQCISESEKLINEAHNIQTELIVNESRGEKNEFSVLLIHAQDTLMNSILLMTVTKEMVEMYNMLKVEER
ncbi:PTS lactose/cellobiose transporter subunit IIA [Virgibacillus necropolis]|uniref:PTS system lactose-specific EIIA component n=1 Tax=Virgibacillus necropolis TaxID=163877 RepID=A0A221M9N5_9BACI|nr:PTS lactose/cellobiose transporter subunit IIA [Virgibacillus necropolis]ASN04320.1 PTS lactose/cellobiose transporter subunit IIA [Virgibacillus necropolis]